VLVQAAAPDPARTAERADAATLCPVCGSHRASPWHRHRDMVLCRCSDCALVFLDPPPAPAARTALYTDAYAGASTSYFAKRERKLKRSRARVGLMLRQLGRGADGLAFLDVGANGGFMAEAARQAGFTVTGIEPDPVSVAYARHNFPGIDFVHGFLEQIDLAAAAFDLAYCSEVIEHSGDCNRFVAALARALKPGGLLYLTTPDISHWRRPRDLLRWDAFCPPAHCLYFSPSNLTLLLARHGLTVSRRQFAWKPGIKLFAVKSTLGLDRS